MTRGIVIRPGGPADLPEVTAIFNYYVANSTCVWTTTPCSEAERKVWYEEHGAATPILVAEGNGRIVGWGALSKYRTTCAVEDSIYVHHDFHRQGIGSRLLTGLITAARRNGHHSILAVISEDQEPSIRLHEEFGFQEVGRFRQLGCKFGRWLDCVYLQLLLPPT